MGLDQPINLSLVQFGFCTGHNRSDVLIVGLKFRINIPSKTLLLGGMRLALTGMVDSEARYRTYYWLASQMCDGNRLKGPLLRLSEDSRRMH
jgi:hypothetical protein